MLNTKKLLYILPDAAYIAEVLPTKKAHTFSIHAFRQINGSFITEDEFIAENVKKLIHKIEAEDYHLILPDFLFTNTIIDIKETKESLVKEYIKEKLLPSLDLTKETHEIDTFILTQHAGKTKVQLSALERSLLDPIREAAADQKLTISHISPLSWTIKSVISLEPSLSTIQIGEMLYMALHYIGVDQTISFNISETANIIETVKTLKGAEPNIQTMYLLTNGVVEQQIKEQLSGTLPIQQLTNLTDETEGIPSFIKQIILAGARTLDLPEQPIPRFSLGKESSSAVASISEEMPVKTPPLVTDEQPELAKTLPTLPEKESGTLPPPSMPLPVMPPITSSIPEIGGIEQEEASLAETPKITEASRPTPKVLSLDDDEEAEPAFVAPIVALQESTTEVKEVIVETKNEDESDAFSITDFKEYQSFLVQDDAEHAKVEPVLTVANESVITKESAPPKPELVPVEPVVLPSYLEPEQKEIKTEISPSIAEKPLLVKESKPLPERKVIKNNNDAGALLKIVLITLGALVTTVVVGVGIGFGLLKLSEKNGAGLQTPVVQTTPSPKIVTTPTPVVTPSASPSAAIDKSKFKILVVNATTTAGAAGKIKTSLTAAGYKSIATGNAKGTYSTPGNYLLVENKNSGNLSALSKDSGLTLSLGTTKAAEDATSIYDAVIVIAE